MKNCFVAVEDDGICGKSVGEEMQSGYTVPDKKSFAYLRTI